MATEQATLLNPGFYPRHRRCSRCGELVFRQGWTAHLTNPEQCVDDAGESDPLANTRPSPGFEDAPDDGVLTDLVGDQPDGEEAH